MTKMKQKDAVVAALRNVCGDVDGAYNPSSEERKQVNNILFEGFKEGKIELSKDYDDAQLKSYCSGLTSNWLRKHKELNGGVQYVAKNPGSRAGSTDPTIKAMRTLLSTKTDQADRNEIQEAINARIAEIKPSKSVTLSDEQKAALEAAGLGHFVS